MLNARVKSMIGMTSTAVILAFPRDAQATVSWAEVQLVDATGVPASPVHDYTFKGILTLWHTKSESSTSVSMSIPPVQSTSTSQNVVDATIWVQGKGRWDQKTNEAEEKLTFQGDVKGEFASRLKCIQDPWLYPTSCTVLSAQYASSQGKTYDWRGMVLKWQRPLTQPAVTLANAAELSKKHASTAPPPPPPAPKPVLAVTHVRVKIEPNCQAPEPAMTVMVTIKNAGGVLPASKGTVFVKEQGGANLSSAGIQLPAIGAGQTQAVSIPAVTLQPYSALEGVHKVQVVLNPQSEGGLLSFVKPADPYVFSAVFPAGHCKRAAGQQPQRR